MLKPLFVCVVKPEACVCAVCVLLHCGVYKVCSESSVETSCVIIVGKLYKV